MKTRTEIEKDITDAEELLTNLKAQLVENFKQVDKYNAKLENLKKLNPGDEVRLNKVCKKWYGKHGFKTCTVGGVIKDEKGALYYVGDKLIEAGKYKLIYIEYRNDVGAGPGGKFTISYPGFNVPSQTIYFGVENLILKDK